MTCYQCLSDQEIEQEKPKVDQILNHDNLELKASFFKVLGDLNRIKIIELLKQYDQLCVYEIAAFIEASVATTSHHLITLKNHNLIKSHKIGKRVIYSMNCEKFGQFIDLADKLTPIFVLPGL